MKLSKNDYIALIIEHCVNQGYKSSDDFVTYCTMVLPMMSTEDLASELEKLECEPLCDISDMPENYGLGCSWN